ncbi:MAG TPA: CAP domain-containing protein [Chloroflexota bacterium]|nr:CAP domain-containing protein [Chloroflexota bacterium]
MKSFRALVCALAILAAIGSASFAAYAHSPSIQPRSVAAATSIAKLQQRLLKIVNKERRSLGAGPLTLNSKLSSCALRHSIAMQRSGKQFHDITHDVCIAHNYDGENVGHQNGKPLAALKKINKQMWNEGPCPVKLVKGLVCTPFGNAADFALWEAHSHYLNLTCKLFSVIGIGIYIKNGWTWLTEDFVGYYHKGDPRSTFCTNRKNGGV